jgi:DHA1 family multidrug resistance protein-like MFS transporter
MITRFFAGVGASAPPAVVAGALADMFDARERATAVVFYSLAIVAGPTLGPLVGSATAESHLGWRWTEVRLFSQPAPFSSLASNQTGLTHYLLEQYLVVILTSFVAILGLWLVPETFAPALLTTKAKKLRHATKQWDLHSKRAFRPLRSRFSRRCFLANR